MLINLCLCMPLDTKLLKTTCQKPWIKHYKHTQLLFYQLEYFTCPWTSRSCPETFCTRSNKWGMLFPQAFLYFMTCIVYAHVCLSRPIDIISIGFYRTCLYRRPNFRPSVRPSTFMTKFDIYVKVWFSLHQ